VVSRQQLVNRLGQKTKGITKPVSTPPLVVPHLALPWLSLDDHPRAEAPASIEIRPILKDDWRGSAQLFVKLAEESKVNYLIDLEASFGGEASESVLGPELSYPAQRRLFATLQRSPQDLPLVVDRPPNRAASGLLAEALLASRFGHQEEARALLAELSEADPSLSLGELAKAEAALAAQDLSRAEEALRSARADSRLNPYARALEAELALKRGERREARFHLSEAFALYPGYAPSRTLFESAFGQGFEAQVFRPPVRIRSAAASVADSTHSPRGPPDYDVKIEVNTEKSEAWLAWALCQATTRYETDRALLPFDDPPAGVSLRREIACVLALVDAATSPRGTNTRDPQLLRLLRIAKAGSLAEFTIYEVIAPRFPALLLHLSKAQRQRLIRYIDRFVLPSAAPPARR